MLQPPSPDMMPPSQGQPMPAQNGTGSPLMQGGEGSANPVQASAIQSVLMKTDSIKQGIGDLASSFPECGIEQEIEGMLQLLMHAMKKCMTTLAAAQAQQSAGPSLPY